VKIYMSVDMEGITGIVHREQIMSEGREYERGRQLMTQDLNAAIEGAVRAGATEILVNDSHATMRNILLSEMKPPARLITGAPSTKDMCQLQGLDETFDAAFLIGYHARADTFGAILSHTIASSAVAELRINGRPQGETGLNAVVAGHFGVPVALVTGDTLLAEEAREYLPPGVEIVAVKTSIGRTVADCMLPEVTYDLIADAAERAVQSPLPEPIEAPTPIEVEIDLQTSEMTDRVAYFLDLPRRGGRTVILRAETAPAAYRLAWKAIQLALMAPPSWLA
jgi:D-amino peptidase